MSTERENLFDELFEIAAKYNVELTNSPAMHPGVPEIGDFCGDVEAAVLAAGYRKAPTIPIQVSAWLINEHRVSWDKQGIGSCRRCGPLDGALESWEHQARILAGADTSREGDAK